MFFLKKPLSHFVSMNLTLTTTKIYPTHEFHGWHVSVFKIGFPHRTIGTVVLHDFSFLAETQ